MTLSNAQLGFLLVCFAGSATGLGAAVVFSETLVGLASKAVLASALALAGGVMVYVSFVEIFVKAQDAFEAPLGPNDAYLAATVCLFAGAALMWALDALVHSLDPSKSAGHTADPCQFVAESVGTTEADASVVAAPAASSSRPVDVEAAGGPAAADGEPGTASDAGSSAGGPAEPETEMTTTTSSSEATSQQQQTPSSSVPEHWKESVEKLDAHKLKDMGLKTALAIGFHNLPEGLATFVATIASPSVGAALAIAIAIHNVPEGLCVAMPIYFATGSRWKAFKWAVWSGLSEPIGAALGWLVLANVVNELVYGILFGLVGGMMIMIVMHELMPTAHRYDPDDKYVTKFFTAGMAVMAASLCLFTYG